MLTNAQFVFKELDAGIAKPFYLVMGEEIFQASEILKRFRQHFLKDADSESFQYESFEGDHVSGQTLVEAVQTLPGLFADLDSKRFIVCTKWDKAHASVLEQMDSYFRDPSPTTTLLLFAVKADKRKAWYKLVEEHGHVMEVADPYDRDWPKWQGFFEKRVGKRIDARAWERLVEAGNRSLSLVNGEVEKAAMYVGERNTISLKDVSELSALGDGGDVFAFVEQVVSNHAFDALRRWNRLMLSGENEIKILSLLVRQFRQVDQALTLMKKGITDTKVLAPQLGVHPFFVPKILQQAKAQTPKRVNAALALLAETDYQMKRGEGRFFESFLMPYLGGRS